MEDGSLMALDPLRLGRQVPNAGRLKTSEGAGECNDCACTVSWSLEETGLRRPAFTGRAPTNWFSASSTADKKSYKAAEVVGLCIWKLKNTLLLLLRYVSLRMYARNQDMKGYSGQAPMAHTCNPSNSRGRDQEDLGFKANPSQIVCKTLFQKYPTQNRAGRMAPVACVASMRP
jgi:hypothetical protein